MAPETERDMETLIGYVLLIGVMLSVALIIAGLVWSLAAAGSLGTTYEIKGINLSGFLAITVHRIAIGRADPHAILNLGICTLLLTPFTRVFASVVYFAFVEHNWKYSAFTCIVLGILTYSLFLR